MNYVGSKYNTSMSTKDIATSIRCELKAKFPGCKFSVTMKKFSMGSSIAVTLMSAPKQVFTQETIDYAKENNVSLYCNINHYGIQSIDYITAYAKEILEKTFDIVKSYNYDNSDIMSDYHETNFYIHIAIGKWDKPFIVRGD